MNFKNIFPLNKAVFNSTKRSLLLLLCFQAPLAQASSPDKLSYTSATQKLDILFSFDPTKSEYTAEYQLTDLNNLKLNQSKFIGCTYASQIGNVGQYLIENKQIIVSPLAQGFAIQTLVGCGAQSAWTLHVITPKCTASAPSTNENGAAIPIGTDAHTLKFGYLQGFGASRSITEASLTLSQDGTIVNSSAVPPEEERSLVVSCK